MFLKQSTAAVIPFGPFVDETDGVTLQTGLVSALDHASTGIKLSKNGGALTIRHASVTASTYDTYGNYLVTLDTTDTNTLGRLQVQFADATTNLPVWADFTVIAANVFDALIGGGDLLDVSLVQVNGAAQTATLDTVKADTVSILAKLLKYVQLMVRKDAAIATDNATELTAINANGGSGAGAYVSTTDSLEAERDNIGTAGAGLTAADDATLAAIAALNNLSAAQVNTEVDTALADYDGPTHAELTSELAGISPPTANQNADALLDRANGIETGWTLRQVLRLISAAIAGKMSGGGSGTEVFRNVTDSKDRITATVDGSGNRTEVTKDVS